jgi:hypothetical protein
MEVSDSCAIGLDPGRALTLVVLAHNCPLTLFVLRTGDAVICEILKTELSVATDRAPTEFVAEFVNAKSAPVADRRFIQGLTDIPTIISPVLWTPSELTEAVVVLKVVSTDPGSPAAAAAGFAFKL